MERKGADLRFRFVPLRSSIWRRGTRARYTPAIHHTPRRETRQFMRVLIFSLSFYFLFFSLPTSFLPLLFVNWHRQDIRLGEAE